MRGKRGVGEFAHIILRILLLFTAVCVLGNLGGCGNRREKAKQEVVELEKLFPLIEKHRVTSYHNLDWYQRLSYSKGFFTTTKDSRSALGHNDPQAFDDEARAVFDSISKQIDKIGVPISVINEVTFDPRGRLSGAKFHLEAGFIRVYDIYSPNYKTIPENGFEQYYSPINKDWYRLIEDWN